MYVTASYGYKGLKITTMRVYTNEEELANFIRRCRRAAIQQIERSIEQHLQNEQHLQQSLYSRETRQLQSEFVDSYDLQTELEYLQYHRRQTEQTLASMRNSTLEEFILSRNYPTVYFCENNPIDPLHNETRHNQKLGPQQLLNRLRNANVQLDDRVMDILLPEDLH
jgi:hypothetical protein